MTRAVVPSMTHSNWVFGPIRNCLRTSDGTETCPRFVTFVRITLILQENGGFYTSLSQSTCNCTFGAASAGRYAFPDRTDLLST